MLKIKNCHNIWKKYACLRTFLCIKTFAENKHKIFNAIKQYRAGPDMSKDGRKRDSGFMQFTPASTSRDNLVWTCIMATFISGCLWAVWVLAGQTSIKAKHVIDHRSTVSIPCFASQKSLIMYHCVPYHCIFSTSVCFALQMPLLPNDMFWSDLLICVQKPDSSMFQKSKCCKFILQRENGYIRNIFKALILHGF